MHEEKLLVDGFAAHRSHLRAVAYRILGSPNEADDAVQEAWLRLSGAGGKSIDNLRGWLTTVVARVSLDMLRACKSRREEPLGYGEPELPGSFHLGPAAEAEIQLADSVGLALLVVLDTLTPAERLAFMLHDMFDMPFAEIAVIVGRSSTATRQLASRARRRVRRRETVPAPAARLRSQRRVVDAFLAAARAGDLEALLAVLDPDVVLRADSVVGPTAASIEVRGASAVARGALAFSGRARFSRILLVNGAVGLVFAPHGRVGSVLAFVTSGDRITAIDIIAERRRIRRLTLTPLEDDLI